MAKSAKKKTTNPTTETAFATIKAFVEKAIGHGLVATEEEKEDVESSLALLDPGTGEE